MEPHRPPLSFTLKTSTWVSNSHGLYDYESHTVSAKTYRCFGRNAAYRVLRKGVDVSLVTEALGHDLLVQDLSIQTIAKLTALEEGAYALEPVGPLEDFELRQTYHKARNPDNIPPSPQDLDQLKEDLAFWVVMRSLRDGSVPLRNGDRVKLGRLAFRIRHIVLSDNQVIHTHICSNSAQTIGSDDDDLATCETRRSDPAVAPAAPSSRVLLSQSMPPPVSVVSESSSSSSQEEEDSLATEAVSESSTAPVPAAPVPVSVEGGAVCRVCLCEEEEASNPLISPCKCAGSMQWIHIACLRTWMEGRLNVKNEDDHGVHFFWRPLACELCQDPYPTYVDLGGGKPVDAKASGDPVDRALKNLTAATDDKIVELFQIPKPAVPFVVLGES